MYHAYQLALSEPLALCSNLTQACSGVQGFSCVSSVHAVQLPSCRPARTTCIRQAVLGLTASEGLRQDYNIQEFFL